MKRFLSVFVLLAMFGMAFALPPGFTGSGSVETAYQSATEVVAVDYAFALSGFFTYSIDQSVVLKDGVASANFPEFAIAYSKYGFTAKGTYSDFIKGKLGYSYDVSGVVTIAPAVYYKKVIEPETLDGTYGGEIVFTKGTAFLPALGLVAEFDADYVTEFNYAFAGTVSYLIGDAIYIKPYLDTDYAFADSTLVTNIGLAGSFLSGVSFDLNYVFEENTYEISLTVSY